MKGGLRTRRSGSWPMRFAALAALLTAAGTLHAQAPVEAAPYDLILRGGTVIDGTGSARFAADVAIRDGWIVRVGDLAGAQARTELDARGLYVAPGFINLHSHARPDALPVAANMLTQGVTTEVLNPDGGGPLDVGAQLDRLGAGGLAIHVAANVGFNSIWTAVVGREDRRATPEEIEQMRGLVLAGLQSGAVGVSAGLDYKPAYFATTDEVVGVVEAGRDWRTSFSNHERLTPESDYSSRVGIAETLAIASRAGLVPIVTHMKAQGHEQGTGGALIEMIVGSAAPGSVAAADVYPYLAGQTGLGSLLVPAWAVDGGRDAMLERFRDPEARARIVAEIERAMTLRFGGPQGVFVTGLRIELTEVMRDMGSSAGEAVVRLLTESNHGSILRFGTEDDLVAIMQGPTTSIACDCGASTGRVSHPRYYGSYPRVLGRYVRERGELTWEDAIFKMSGLPAATVGLHDRGVIAPGTAADLVAFDPGTVADRATFEDPTGLSVGVEHVVVGGVLALRDGQPTGARGGRALRRERRAPSRAAAYDVAREVRAVGRLRAPGTGADLGVAVDVLVRQNGGSRPAGRIRVEGPAGAGSSEAAELGVVHAARGWAALYAIARVDGVEIPVRILLEEADPQAGGRPTAEVRVGEDVPVFGLLDSVRVEVAR